MVKSEADIAKLQMYIPKNEGTAQCTNYYYGSQKSAVWVLMLLRFKHVALEVDDSSF